MVLNENKKIADYSSNIKLNIISAGYAKVDESWQDTVINSPFSRIYFILNKSFKVKSLTGEFFEFKENGVYLIPSGFSYNYSCDSEMEHVFFHFRLTGFGKIDLLKKCEAPVGIVADLSDKDKYIKLALCENSYDTVGAQAEILSSLCKILNKSLIENIQYTFSICEAISYIENNLSIQLNLGDIAKKARISSSTLTRQFRKETGMSIGEYIDNLIMLEAEEKLRFSNMSISEISDFYGFCDQFYFSRRFKERYGMSPREYKKSIII